MRLSLTGRAAGLLMAGLLAGAAGPEALWLTQDRDSVIELRNCDAGLCGRIVGMSELQRPDGTAATDRQGRPLCGLTILHARPDGPDSWSGQITDPETGTAWNSVLRLDGEGRLKLRGYVLVPLLGQTHTWTRYTGKLGGNCAMMPGGG